MRHIRLLFILHCILACGVFADTNWNVESGVWSDDANWSAGKPDASDGYINIRYSATSICTLNTDEGIFTARLVMQNGQTLNIEDGGSFGAKWARIGRGTAAYVNMTGNGTYILNDDDLYVGLEGGYCEWKLFDTSSLMVAAATAGGDNLYIAEDAGSGLFQINGSGVTVSVDDLYLTANNPGGTATLEYIMDAGGASTIQVAGTTYIAGSGEAHLILSAPGVTLAGQDIVLIQSSNIGGSGVFTSVNGYAAAEGAMIVVGGNVYKLTYNYNGGQDVALVYVQTAKHLAADPYPANGSVLSASPTTLSWINPDPNDGMSNIVCTVYFGMAPADPNRMGMDRVTLAANANSVEINASNFPTYGAQPIEDVNDFYWVVDCADASPGVDPALGKAPLSWMFSTSYNKVPVVDAGPDQIEWGLPKVISLSGAVSDDGLPNPPGAVTATWTQTSGPDGGAVINAPASAGTTVNITESGVYVFELTADDGLAQVSDSVEVIVGTDSCEASYLNGSNYNSKDFDQDCDVDINDLAAFMVQWLDCTNTLEGCI